MKTESLPDRLPTQLNLYTPTVLAGAQPLLYRFASSTAAGHLDGQDANLIGEDRVLRELRSERLFSAVRIAAIAVLFAACGTDASLPTSNARPDAAQLQPTMAVASGLSLDAQLA